MSKGSLSAYQSQNKERTVALVRSTMTLIEGELASGSYPFNRGRLNRREFCRRAGIGESTLKNPTHVETSKLLAQWLHSLAPASRQKSEPAPLNATQQLAKIARELDLFKLRYEELRAENSELRKEAAQLSEQLRRHSPPHLKLISE